MPPIPNPNFLRPALARVANLPSCTPDEMRAQHGAQCDKIDCSGHNLRLPRRKDMIPPCGKTMNRLSARVAEQEIAQGRVHAVSMCQVRRMSCMVYHHKIPAVWQVGGKLLSALGADGRVGAAVKNNGGVRNFGKLQRDIVSENQSIDRMVEMIDAKTLPFLNPGRRVISGTE